MLGKVLSYANNGLLTVLTAISQGRGCCCYFQKVTRMEVTGLASII